MDLRGFLFGTFVDLAIYHIASKSFETLHASPNDCLLMIKVSLGHLLFLAEKLLEFYTSNILPLSFMYLNFLKLVKYHEWA